MLASLCHDNHSFSAEVRPVSSGKRRNIPHNAPDRIFMSQQKVMAHLVQLVLHDLEVQLHHVVAAQPLEIVRNCRHMQVHLQRRRNS